MTSPTITLDPVTVKQMVDHAVEQNIMTAIQALSQDPAWLEKIERQISQTMVDKIIAQLSATDITPIIKQHVNENMAVFRKDILEKFSSSGIDDQATACQLTVMDGVVVVEDQLTAKDINVVNAATIRDLVVTGSVNIDNSSWIQLAQGISDQTLERRGDTFDVLILTFGFFQYTFDSFCLEFSFHPL